MKIAIIGTGYVGLVSGTCLAELGHEVVCVDSENEKIELLQNNEVPIYEPGLETLILTNSRQNRLRFSTDLRTAVQWAEIVFIAVGTPSNGNGSADLTCVFNVAQEIGSAMNGYKVVATKSTVPVGTNRKIKHIIRAGQAVPVDFSVVSNPEFLREGAAIHDALYPERIVIGVEDVRAGEVMLSLYDVLDTEKVITNLESAEMIKYASNAFLATKISFINEIANICERVRADVQDVAKGMGLDSRIGGKFLNAGIGFGGSCFPKDVRALAQTAAGAGYDFKIIEAVMEVNKSQRMQIVDKLWDLLGGVNGKKIALLGLAFKPNTDDMREAPSVEIANILVTGGAKVMAYDSVAGKTARNTVRKEVTICDSLEEAVSGADAAALLTEWAEFYDLDWQTLKTIMRGEVLVDGRNIYDPCKMRELGFKYSGIGRQTHLCRRYPAGSL